LLGFVDHLIVPQTFAEQVTGQSDPARAARKLWTEGREVVIVTCGEEGCWYVERSTSDSPQHQPAFRVAAADTTGCGDVFHGAYASALVRNLRLPERVRFASATAALKATRTGGHAGIPSRSEVEDFVEKNSPK
jgi:sulfofructose kinase